MPRVTITVAGKNSQPYRFQLDRRLVSLGRGSNNDIVIECPSVSVIHAQMCRVHGGYELRDLGSTNGIKLCNECHQVIQLHNGMTIYLGDVAFDFELSDEELEALSLEAPIEESPIVQEPAEPSIQAPLATATVIDLATASAPILAPAPPQRDLVTEVKLRAADAVDEPKLPPLPQAPVHQEVAQEIPQSRRRGCGPFVWLFVLVMSAFIVGMAIRFQRETGGSWLGSVFSRVQTSLVGTPDASAKELETGSDVAE